MAPRCGWFVRLLTVLATLAVATVLLARDACAADLPGARLTVTRSSRAQSCPDERELLNHLPLRMATSANGGSLALFLDVHIDQSSGGFTATIEVSGRKRGVRTLEADGPTCDPLRDSLAVALLLLLDDDPQHSERPPEPKPVPAARPVTEAAPELHAAPLELSLAVGGAVTHGLPLGWSYAVSTEMIANVGHFEAGLGGLWAPVKEFSLDTSEGTELGKIRLGMAGGRARACYVGSSLSSPVRLSGCAVAIISALSGEGFSSDQVRKRNVGAQLWVLAGAGPDLYIGLSPRIGLAISAGILASTRVQEFTVTGGRVSVIPYNSDPIEGWGALDVRVRIW